MYVTIKWWVNFSLEEISNDFYEHFRAYGSLLYLGNGDRKYLYRISMKVLKNHVSAM